MTAPFLRAYTLQCIQVCHKRKIAAMGGMAAQIPIKNDQSANAKALNFVQKDKERESTDGFSKHHTLRHDNLKSCKLSQNLSGHDGTWVAHPDLVAVAKEVFDRIMPEKNQISKELSSFSVTNQDLTVVPEGTRTDAGFRRNVSVAIGKYKSTRQVCHGCIVVLSIILPKI